MVDVYFKYFSISVENEDQFIEELEELCRKHSYNKFQFGYDVEENESYEEEE